MPLADFYIKRRFKYISCSYLSTNTPSTITDGAYLNTSHVLIYHGTGFKTGCLR